MKNLSVLSLLTLLMWTIDLHNQNHKIQRIPKDSPAACAYNPHDDFIKIPRNIHDDVEAIQAQNKAMVVHQVKEALDIFGLTTQSTWDDIKKSYETYMTDTSSIRSLKNIHDIDHAFLVLREYQDHLQDPVESFRTNATQNPYLAFKELGIEQSATWEDARQAQFDLFCKNIGNEIQCEKLKIAFEVIDKLRHNGKLPSQELEKFRVSIQEHPMLGFQILALEPESPWKKIEQRINELHISLPGCREKLIIIKEEFQKLY